MQINNRDVMRYHESAREIAAREQIAQGHGDLVESRRPATDQIVRNHIVVAGNRSVQDEVRQKAISELRKWTGESELAASFIRVLDDPINKAGRTATINNARLNLERFEQTMMIQDFATDNRLKAIKDECGETVIVGRVGQSNI